MIPVAALKQHLKIEHITADDAYLADLEAQAVAVVELYTGKVYPAVGERIEYVTGDGTNKLRLALAPILSDPVVDADVVVAERSSPGGEATNIVMAEDDGFVVRDTELLRRSGGVWTSGYEYEVTYNGGYAPGSQDEKARGAVRDMVALWYTNRTPSVEREAAALGLLALLGSNPVLA